MNPREVDRAHMRRCLELAERYRGRTAPNPIVGCVVVDPASNHVLAEGAHRRAGTAHAEIAALATLAGRRAPGATLYVNLEPCNHHGRTPPCAPAARAAGIARVVVGMDDPIPGHGGGIEHLRRAGVTVSVGVLREACERANLGWARLALAHRPAFTLKAGMTLDGKIATVSGHSKWITGERARTDVMRQRDRHDAVLVGIGTVLADDPWLTARLPRARDPMRIVLDSRLRTPPSAHLLPKRLGPRTVIACGARASARAERALVARGAEVWRLGTHKNGRVDLNALARALGDAGIMNVLVEGGGDIHEAFLRARLADELLLYIAPKVVGGPAKSWVGGPGLATLANAYGFAFDDDVVRLGDDLRVRAYPVVPGP